MDAVLRLLRGELSRELEVEAHRLAAWRDEFLEHGKQGLKAARADRGDPAELRLEQSERKVGELTLEVEILRAAAEKMGASDPAEEAATMTMDLKAPLSTVCDVLDAPRSTIYARRTRADNVTWLPPGPVGAIGDEQLVTLIRQVLDESPFTGEGYPKVRALLRREHGVQVSASGWCGCSPRNARPDVVDLAPTTAASCPMRGM